ncbi:MAG: fibronectin type III domain-containing protein [Planctomycetota bacterium]|nr:fibronectin type III domain-containing protein [Planctomycetota bacterium]
MNDKLKWGANMALAFAVLASMTAICWAQGKGGGKKPPKNEDTDPPPAITDLAVDEVSSHVVLLSWTASRDDTNDPDSGRTSQNDLRYLVDEPITEQNWDTATPAPSDPTRGSTPFQPGMTETFNVTCLEGDTTYYFAIKVSDEAGNESDLCSVPNECNVASGTTVSAKWTTEVVVSGGPFYYNVLAFDPADGGASIAYSSPGNLNYAHWNGSTWDTEVVDEAGGGGLDFTFDPDGAPTISYVGSTDQLMFARRGGTGWETEVIDSKLFDPLTSLAYDPAGNPSISYTAPVGKGKSKTSEVRFARWNDLSQSWDVEAVEILGIRTRYNSLAYNPAGNPSIAYPDWLDDQLSGPDTLKLATWNEGTWDIEVVDTGMNYMGIGTALAYAADGNPSIVHRAKISPDQDSMRYLHWDGTTWHPVPAEIDEIIDDGAQDFHFSAGTLAFDPSGTPYVSYVDDLLEVKVAHWDGVQWVIEGVEGCLPGYSSIAFDPAGVPPGVPSISYRRNWTSDLEYAQRLP